MHIILRCVQFSLQAAVDANSKSWYQTHFGSDGLMLISRFLVKYLRRIEVIVFNQNSGLIVARFFPRMKAALSTLMTFWSLLESLDSGKKSFTSWHVRSLIYQLGFNSRAYSSCLEHPNSNVQHPASIVMWINAVIIAQNTTLFSILPPQPQRWVCRPPTIEMTN